MDISRNLNQTATYWEVTGSDGFGGDVFAAPVTFRVRWQDKAEQYRNANNEEVVSHAIVYLLDDVAVGSYLALGDHSAVADPVTLNSSGTIARMVEMVHKTTDLAALIALRKAYL